MKSTKINDTLQKTLQKAVSLISPVIMTIVHEIARWGGRALLVGGAVRDLLLHKPMKDWDIEVHGLSLAALESILKTYGTVSLVGKAFGVLHLHGVDADWALPRADQPGRKPRVQIHPAMAMQQAFRRRDLTINAMGIDLITYELIDPFNGKHDLDQKILRCPDPHFFVEDPLRFYRVMQFIGRFAFYPDKELNQLCATMDIRGVSVERIETEFEKLLLYAGAPSRGIRWLRDCGRLQEILPELAATCDVVQPPQWHPEGDVFEHSMQTLDASVAYVYDNSRLTLALRYAALCHDIGKAAVTEIDEAGNVRSYGHEEVGEKIARQLLKRITRNNELIALVGTLVRYHMAPLLLVQDNAKQAAYKRLARAVAPELNLMILADLSCADQRGRNEAGPEPLNELVCGSVQEFKKRAQEALVFDRPELPILQGRDLLDVISPGPELGKAVSYAYQIQLEEGIKDPEQLRKRVLAVSAKKLTNKN